jgi:ABC-type branched-subunit amino acid transport system substrate-binding protein
MTVVVATLAAVSIATATIASARVGGGGGGDQALEATDVGVSADEIRIAVLADVENDLQPGLFQGTPDAMEGFEEYINDQGGLAGRKLVVDFIDSHLDADETRNAIVEACENDFALVATTSLFLNNIDDMVECVNADGVAVGLPDFPVLTTEPAHQCSPVSHPITPPALDCATIDEHPQTYRANTGPTSYYLEQHDGDLSGVFLYPSDLKSAKDAQLPAFMGQEEKGITVDAEYDLSARAQQSAYTPIAQQMKEDGATYARSGLAFSSTVSLRKEAKLQGVNSVEVWDCWVACYTGQLLEQGGSDVEDQYVSLNLVPFFDEAKANKMTSNFVRYTGKDEVDGFGAQAWAAGVYFRDTVNAVVEAGGNNAVTREAVLQAAEGINDFTADGMMGSTDVGDRVPSSCFALLQVRDGDFKRIHPKKKASFDCEKSNRVTLQLDLLAG